MDKRAFVALRSPRWVTLIDDLEVELVPASMPDMTMARVLGTTPDRLARDLCTNSFINFRGWEEDGSPIENTLDNRIELYSFPGLRAAINNALEAANADVLEGEGSAASD